MHMMRNDSDVFKKLWRNYFSTIFKDKIKVGICIKKLLNYACVKGEVKLVLFDDREKVEVR